jgi:hypothetical protein
LVARIQAAEPIRDAVDSPPALNRVIIMISAATSFKTPVSLATGPPGNSRVERQLLKRFVAPAFSG